MHGEVHGGGVLIVDDDASTRHVLQRVLAVEGHTTHEAASAAEAREQMLVVHPALVLLDIGLPDGSGLDLAREILGQTPDVAVIMISGRGSPSVGFSAVDLGAYGYLAKPFTSDAVLIAVHNARRRQHLEQAGREQREALELEVSERTVQLSSALCDLNDALAEATHTSEETIQRLSRVMEYRDRETSGHVLRMSRYCGLMGQAFGLDETEMRTACSMHDVGKVGVPDAVLLKPGRLTHDERIVMQRHTSIGYEVLSGSGSALLDLAARVALSHHERWDGHGYPDGLSRREIPLEARIAAAADVFDAVTTARVYRPLMLSRSEALAYLFQLRGTQFDPAVVDVMFEVGIEIQEVRNTTPGVDHPAVALAGWSGG